MTPEEFDAKLVAAHAEALVEDTARQRKQMEWERQPRESGWHHAHHSVQAVDHHYKSWPHVGNGFEETRNAFHISGGLFAQRLNCDCVVLRSLLPRRKPDGEVIWDNHIVAIFAPMVWASIVCSVSMDGETAERWQHIQEFHGASR